MSPACLILFMRVLVLPAPFVFVGLEAAFSMMITVLVRALVQAVSDISYQGRMMSVAMMVGGLSSFAALPAAALAERFGVAPVLTAMAATAVGFQVAVLALEAGCARASLGPSSMDCENRCQKTRGGQCAPQQTKCRATDREIRS